MKIPNCQRIRYSIVTFPNNYTYLQVTTNNKKSFHPIVSNIICSSKSKRFFLSGVSAVAIVQLTLRRSVQRLLISFSCINHLMLLNSQCHHFLGGLSLLVSSSLSLYYSLPCQFLSWSPIQGTISARLLSIFIPYVILLQICIVCYTICFFHCYH
jgi:hypothetical protein